MASTSDACGGLNFRFWALAIIKAERERERESVRYDVVVALWQQQEIFRAAATQVDDVHNSFWLESRSRNDSIVCFIRERKRTFTTYCMGWRQRRRRWRRLIKESVISFVFGFGVGARNWFLNACVCPMNVLAAILSRSLLGSNVDQTVG